VSESLPFTTQDEWVSLLRLAHRFDFASMRTLATKQLFGLTSAVDRILLAREFAVDEWLRPAYIDICTMPDLIPDEDIARLGLELFQKLARARDKLKSFSVSPTDNATRIVNETFQLCPAESEDRVLVAPDALALGSTEPAPVLASDDWFVPGPTATKKSKSKASANPYRW
jgi:hypothetical protein